MLQTDIVLQEQYCMCSEWEFYDAHYAGEINFLLHINSVKYNF